MREMLRILLSLLLILFVYACGGGSGGSSGADADSGGGAAPAGGHAALTWDGSPGVCLSCHAEEARQMYASAHYQWQGEALYDAANGPLMQGRISDAFNSYCINILGNWNACGSCHVGLGEPPVLTAAPSDAQLRNIDCLVCHQKDYKRVKVDGVFVPDTAKMTISLNQAVQRRCTAPTAPPASPATPGRAAAMPSNAETWPWPARPPTTPSTRCTCRLPEPI